MDAWVLWIIAAVLLAVGEVLTLSFFLAPFAAGAVLAAVADALGAGTVVTWLLFIVSSLMLLTLARPIARRHLYTPPQVRTGTAALVGETGIALERIAGGEDGGTIRLRGEVWTARPYDDEAVIEAGRRVHVMEIRGATALVTES